MKSIDTGRRRQAQPKPAERAPVVRDAMGPLAASICDDNMEVGSARVVHSFVSVLLLLGFEHAAIQEGVRRTSLPKSLKPLKRLESGISDSSRLLSRWAADPHFLSEDGRPRDLRIRGTGVTFETLVNRELTGANPTRCLTILLESGSVVRVKGGRIRWRTRIASRMHSKGVSVEAALLPLQGLLDTLQQNLTDVAAGRTARLVEMGVSGFELNATHLDELRRLFARQGILLLETIEAWLAQHGTSARPAITSEPTVRPYLGIFMSKDSGP